MQISLYIFFIFLKFLKYFSIFFTLSAMNMFFRTKLKQKYTINLSFNIFQVIAIK